MLIYSVLFIFPLCLYFFSMKKKQKSRTKMEKMMLAMGASMLVGLTIGLFIGGLLHGSFFSALLLSAIISVLVGFLIGFPHGAIGSVEGVFSGGMAGLMGAMTAEMLSIPEIRILLLFFLLLMGLGAFWSLHFWKKNEEEQRLKTGLFHIFTMCYLLFITFVFIWYPPFDSSSSNQHEHHTILFESSQKVQGHGP